MSLETSIVLCAGGINYSNLPINTNQSNAMVPVNGKPVIGLILDDLLTKGIDQVIIVIRKGNRRLVEFVTRAYGERMKLSIVPVNSKGSIVHSLKAGLEQSLSKGLVRIILGDTLIRDGYEAPYDFVYTGEVTDSRRWCLGVTSPDGFIMDYLDKQESTAIPKMALAGYYHLLDGNFLRQCVAESLDCGERELSAVLRRYGTQRPIRSVPAGEWFDFGHIDNLLAARRQLLQSRYFNSLTIHPVLNTITKTSRHDGKLQDELDWYLGLPAELQVLTPRVIQYQQENGHLCITQEYYGYPTLAELYVFGEVSSDTWISILRQVMRIHTEFCRYSSELSETEIQAMYWGKTEQRLRELEQGSSYWKDLLSKQQIMLNNQTLRGLPQLLPVIEAAARRLSSNASVRIIHGDFCLSNILFDINNQIIRLIDPRGRFGRKGIYGDPRYDIAKLRHSIAGHYDYLIANMFSILEERPGSFRTKIHLNGVSDKIAQELDSMIAEAGYQVSEIQLIEGLLFLSMLPLHKDSIQRQQMMYLIALQLLNEVLPCVS